MKNLKATLRASTLLPTLFWCTLPAFAQNAPQPYQGGDQQAPLAADDEPQTPPARGAVYARLRYFEGTISFKRDDESAAGNLSLEINFPFIPGDQVWTGEDGRTEIQLADGTILRLDHDSRLSLLNLADREAAFDNTTLLRVMNGSLYLRTENFDPHDRRFQIDTPSGSVFLLSGGVFRIDVGADGVSSVASYRGVAEILSEDVSVIAHSGERVTAAPGQRPGEVRAFNTLRRDPFDVWTEGRDDSYAVSDASRGERPVVSEPVTPYVPELSRYGSWRLDPTYGWVWVPDNVASDWRPYYYGQWSPSPIGLTWVSYEPWGWAPYHYGRWSWTLGVGWYWVPGAVFSGAYVSWSSGPTYFGWVPLGYYDTPVYYGSYYPWVYVPHSHICDGYVYRHAYSYSDVARYRLEQNSVALRGQPYSRHWGRPEAVGTATYRHAISNPRVAQARPEAGGDAARTPFKLSEQRDYRRALMSRRATLEAGPSTGLVASPRRPGSTRSPYGVSGQGAAASNGQSPYSRGTRPVNARPSEMVPGTGAGEDAISPATGRPIRPPVRVVPQNGAANGQAPQGTVNRRYGGFQTRGQIENNAPSGRGQGAVDRSGQSPATPHPRAGAGSSAGDRRPFVMPLRNRPETANPSRPPAVHPQQGQPPVRQAPPAKSATPQKSKGGGKGKRK